MKTTNKFLALALLAVAMVFVSCSKDDDSAQKGADNFSHDIIGMWEGVEMTGDEANGNAKARIAYYADGTYIHYRKLADVWFPRLDDACEYNIEGNKLTSRWKPEMAENYSSEWWNIDAINDGVMKWSAIRERKDGSQYTATFTWKKVDDVLTSEQIQAKLSGTWTYDKIQNITLLKGEVVKSDIPSFVPQATYTFTNDGKYSFYLPDPDDPTKQRINTYTYILKGDVLCLVTETLWDDGVKRDERSVKGKFLIHAISDDQIILIACAEMPLIGSDTALMIEYLKRVE
ncbi:MAG: hypothetical protein MJZ41_15660 [Bacteroidaceae bacterium]|nr:hypothetical protein [Bacteroidaceae bacterium]